MTSFTPRAGHVLVERLPAAESSAGGIRISEGARELPSEGTVRAVGPERWVPLLAEGLPSPVLWEERVIWQEGAGQPVTAERTWLVLDDKELVAVVSEDGTIEPLNDWCQIAVHGRTPASTGGITLPERAREYEKKGRLLAFGPGELVSPEESVIMAGTRRPVQRVWGLRKGDSLVGKTVYWEQTQGFLWIETPDARDCLMVKAASLIAVEE